jgi:hypothetical protein
VNGEFVIGLKAPLGAMVATGSAGVLTSPIVFPAHEDEGEGDEVDDRGHKGHFDFEADRECNDSGEMDFEDDSGNGMTGKVSAVTATGNTATISGAGTRADGTPVTYTAVVLGNMPVIGRTTSRLAGSPPLVRSSRLREH